MNKKNEKDPRNEAPKKEKKQKKESKKRVKIITLPPHNTKNITNTIEIVDHFNDNQTVVYEDVTSGRKLWKICWRRQ